MYLVDTDVLSSGAPAAGRRTPAFAEWMEAHSAELFLSAVTVAEIASGIAKVARTGRTGRANDLKAWLELVLHLYGDRVMPFDVAAAQIAGALPGSSALRRPNTRVRRCRPLRQRRRVGA